MSPKAIIIYGPPGSGKGTQAELLARKHNFIHFDTGRLIESVVHDPTLQRNPVIRRERKNFDTGILCTPSWVTRIVEKALRQIAKAGYGIVFSGSPRTLYEAFGTNGKNGEVALLEKLYGKKNIHTVFLNVKDASSVQRNTSRLVCSFCGLPILASANNKHCSLCAGAMKKRVLDTKEIMSVRLKEYRERTFPILARMKSMGFKITKVNGERMPYMIAEQISKVLGLR